MSKQTAGTLLALLSTPFLLGWRQDGKPAIQPTPPPPAQSASPATTPPAPMPPGKPEGRYLSAAEVEARHEWEQEHSILFPKLVRGNPKHREIALTFDDGPHPYYTQQILEILRREDIHATFFVIGMMVDRYPELVQQEAAEGHEIANHTYHHLRLPTIPIGNIDHELIDGSQAIERAIGSPVRLYRPPGGEYDDDVVAATKRLGLIMVLWTDDPGDYADPGASVIEERTLRDVSNGGILLLHDGVQQTLDILPDLIMKLKARGFKFVTCSYMARERGVITTGGPRVLPPKPMRKP